MLIAGQVVYGSALEGPDGALGSVQDLYYDNESWQVKYIAVDVGGWLEDHRAMFSPAMILRQDWVERRLWTSFTRERLQDNLATNGSVAPVGRDFNPTVPSSDKAVWTLLSAFDADLEKEANLHSSRRTVGYNVEAYDGHVGTIKDVVVDDLPWGERTWDIRYLVVDARGWLADRFVLISPLWADSLSGDTRQLRVALLRDTIRRSPHYDPRVPISRAYEESLFEYYGMPKYWAKHPV